ncbi:MAG: SDR family NAD(P)-dependent oxidoreductase [Azospirillum sp.]|nr:SDR family NAD(P)-dependent oxidoreductase [Azospirillum sp.]
MTTPQGGCAWVTGASSGIGAAPAPLLARRGWQVAASACRAEALTAAAAVAGGILPVPVDVTDLAAGRAGVDRIETQLGPIGLAVLNAGRMQPMTARTLDSGAIRAQVEVILMGMVHCLEALLARLIARRRGHLVVVTSSPGYRGLPGSVD